MKAFVVYSTIFQDPEFLALDPLGQATYFRLFAVACTNWGNKGYCDIIDLAASLYPERRRMALRGEDPDGPAFFQAVAERIERMFRSETPGHGPLLLHDDVRGGGEAFGFRNWERFTGRSRRGRGEPSEPMGPNIAGDRCWAKIGGRSRATVRDYRRRYGIEEVEGLDDCDDEDTEHLGSPSSELGVPGCSDFGTPCTKRLASIASIATSSEGCGGDLEHTPPTPPRSGPPSPPSDADGEPQAGPAHDLLRRCRALPGQLTEHQTDGLSAVAEAAGCPPEAALVALCLECEPRTDKPAATVLRWKLRDLEPPSADAVARAELILGLRQPARPPKPKRTVDYRCDTCGRTAVAAVAEGDEPETLPCGWCEGSLRAVEPNARLPACPTPEGPTPGPPARPTSARQPVAAGAA